MTSKTEGLTYETVAAEVRQFVADGDGDYELWNVRWTLANRLDGSKDRRGNLTSRFTAQVKRELDRLAETGELVKSGSGRELRYRTRPQQQAHERSIADYRAASERMNERRTRHVSALVALGYSPRKTSDGYIAVEPDDWDSIIERLGGR